MNFKLIVTLILIGLAVIFIVQNVTLIKIQFLFWSVSMSRALLIFVLLATGVLIGWFLRSR